MSSPRKAAKKAVEVIRKATGTVKAKVKDKVQSVQSTLKRTHSKVTVNSETASVSSKKSTKAVAVKPKKRARVMSEDEEDEEHVANGVKEVIELDGEVRVLGGSKKSKKKKTSDEEETGEEIDIEEEKRKLGQ
jgi:hypothetical protein